MLATVQTTVFNCVYFAIRQHYERTPLPSTIRYWTTTHLQTKQHGRRVWSRGRHLPRGSSAMAAVCSSWEGGENSTGASWSAHVLLSRDAHSWRQTSHMIHPLVPFTTLSTLSLFPSSLQGTAHVFYLSSANPKTLTHNAQWIRTPRFTVILFEKTQTH